MPLRFLSPARGARLLLLVLVVALAPVALLSQAAVPTASTDTGRFRLHKFEQPIGEETYTITRDANTLTLKSDFEFTDRGSKIRASCPSP